jgi:hypothetical protein
MDKLPELGTNPKGDFRSEFIVPVIWQLQSFLDFNPLPAARVDIFEETPSLDSDAKPAETLLPTALAACDRRVTVLFQLGLGFETLISLV